MKKFLAIIILVSACFAGHAQTLNQTGNLFVHSSALDTNTNATTSYVYFKNIGSHIVSFQVSVTKISGTIGGGSVIIYGSDDLLGWVSLGDTLTITNQALNSAGFPNTGKTTWAHYRAAFNTSGTQSSSLLFTIARRIDEDEQ